jgi:hypothetical protein
MQLSEFELERFARMWEFYLACSGDGLPPGGRVAVMDKIVDNATMHRFELPVEDELAVAYYQE